MEKRLFLLLGITLCLGKVAQGQGPAAPEAQAAAVAVPAVLMGPIATTAAPAGALQYQITNNTGRPVSAYMIFGDATDDQVDMFIDYLFADDEDLTDEEFTTAENMYGELYASGRAIDLADGQSSTLALQGPVGNYKLLVITNDADVNPDRQIVKISITAVPGAAVLDSAYFPAAPEVVGAPAAP